MKGIGIFDEHSFQPIILTTPEIGIRNVHHVFPFKSMFKESNIVTFLKRLRDIQLRKCIRFVNGVKTNEELEALVNFTTTHFPCARFLVNYRSNVTAQAASYSENWRTTNSSATAAAEMHQMPQFALKMMIGDNFHAGMR